MYRLLLLLCLAGHALAGCSNCLTVTNNPPLTPKCAQCAHNDLIFILDQSQSILASNQFPKMLQFVVDVLSQTDAVPGVQQTPYAAYLGGTYGVHAGFVLFNNTITDHAPLWQFLNNDPQRALAAIKAWLYEPAHAITGGLSNICLGLQTAIDDFNAFPRKSVPRTVVLITDGAPNTVTGDCTVDKLASIANTLKQDMNVEVLVVAVNGINGGPASFNYQALAAIASKSTINASVPLLWDLSDNYSLSVPAVRDALTSNMGCCDCYADMNFILELSEATEGGNFHAVFTDVLAFAAGADIGSINSTKNTISLTLFAQDGQIALCPCGNGGCGSPDSVQCNDVTCITDYFNRTCPDALKSPPYSGQCSLKGSLSAGHSSLIAGLTTAETAEKSCPRTYAPKVAVVLASGACEPQANPACVVPDALNKSIADFQNEFRMRYAVGIGDSSHVNWANLRNLVGKVDVDGLSGGLLNDNDSSRGAIASAILSMPGHICRYISDQPGCKCVDCGFQGTKPPASCKNIT